MVPPNRICQSGIQLKRKNKLPLFIFKQNNNQNINKDIKEEMKTIIFDIIKKI